MKHDCPTGCGRIAGAGQLLCRPCWSRVPRDLQRDVYSAWRALRSQKRSNLDAWGEALARYEQVRQAAITAAET